MWNNICLFLVVWRQLEFAFFGALTSVGALFYFTEKAQTKGERKMEEQNNQNFENQESKVKEDVRGTEVKQKKILPSKTKMAIIIGIAGVIVIAIAVVIIVLLGGNNNTDSPTHTHTFGEWKTANNATCIIDGTQERYCDCGEKQTQSISAIGHQYGEWTTATVATCTENGKQERVCTCGEKETKIIDKLAHTEIEAEGKAPTATASGYGKGTVCEVCSTTIKEHVTLYSLRDCVLANPTTVNNGEYCILVNASNLIPTVSGVFQICCSNSSSDVTVSLTDFPSSSVTYITQITLNNVKTTLLTYGYAYYITIGNTQYFDGIKGQFNVSELYNLNELTYNDSASTIGGSYEYQTERFEGYKAPACAMAQNVISLLDAFLEKNNFGYTTEVYGFNPS